MKRFRPLIWDFDSRATTLTIHIPDGWGEDVKAGHNQNKERVRQSLIDTYGIEHSDNKIQNFIEMGPKPLSIVAFHNHFFQQIRSAYVIGSYYPALTGTCTLGERILNHLILKLKNDFKSTPQYKKIYRKKQFDNWSIAIDTLLSWRVLLPEVAEEYRKLMDMRHSAIHFKPETDTNDKDLSLAAIKCLQKIIGNQFSGFGTQPWFITGIPGEIYIKKEWEQNPFINKIYIPCCAYVGPLHFIEKMYPQIVVNDEFEYKEKDITDEQFVKLRIEEKNKS